MQKKETERERKRKALLGEKKEVCSKKSLTGPTLLEMSGYATNQELPDTPKSNWLPLVPLSYK
jgi:hypothetical protein